MIGPYQVCRMHVARVNPFIVAFQESLPLNEILQSLCTSGIPVGEYPFDLLFLLSVDQIWGRPGEVWAMSHRFSVRRKERGMKHIVYPPIIRQC